MKKLRHGHPMYTVGLLSAQYRRTTVGPGSGPHLNHFFHFPLFQENKMLLRMWDLWIWQDWEFKWY